MWGKRTERMKSRAQTREDTGLWREKYVIIVLLMFVLLLLLVLLVSRPRSIFIRSLLETQNKACYGLHNTVFEIIINFKSEGIPFKFQLARGGKQWDPQQIFIERRTSSPTFTQHDKQFRFRYLFSDIFYWNCCRNVTRWSAMGAKWELSVIIMLSATI